MYKVVEVQPEIEGYSDAIQADVKALTRTVEMLIRDLEREVSPAERMEHIINGIVQSALIRDRLSRREKSYGH